MSRAESKKTSVTSLEGEDEQEIVYGEDHLTAVVRDKSGNEILIWPEGFLESEKGSASEYEQDIGSAGPESLRIKQFWGEDNEAFQFYYKGQQEEGEEEEEPSAEEEESHKKFSIEPRPRSIFAHSSPTTFHDVNSTRKSVFGSIFLKTRTSHPNEEAALLRTVTETNYSMLQSLLNSCEKILCESPGTDRRQMTIALRDSILKMLETHGIARIYSDGSFHWDIYPIAQSYLFVVQIGDHIHQTRNLNKVEDRIITGAIQTLRLPYGWPTDSLWSGHWDVLGMAGSGTYVMPHGVSYSGKMKDGLFHDDNATLTYPNKFKAIHCVYEKGKLITCQFQYPDTLIHEKENWAYCKFPDRRFWSEVRNGLQPAKTAQKTELDPPRKIPPGSYDTNNGFYNPKTLMLSSPNGDLLRIPVCEEDIWIKKYCRKGFFEYTDFRPDLFENWFSQKVIDAVFAAQDDFRRQRITYNDLQQIYANLGLLSSAVCAKRSTSEKPVDENNSIPEPRVLNYPRKLKKFEGHHIPHVLKSKLNEEDKTQGRKTSVVFKRSKSSLRVYNEYNKSKRTSSGMNSRSSKINFKAGEEATDSQSKDTGSFQSSPPGFKRKIPDYIMQHQPILRGPFHEMKKIFMQQEWGKKKPSSHYFDEDPWSPTHEEKEEEKAEEEEELQHEAEEFFPRGAIKKSKLINFMKSIIMGRVNEILLRERKREKARTTWGAKISSESRRSSTDRNTCQRDLREFYSSVPEREEYCDSFENSNCQLKKLAVDRYNIVKFWGKRMYYLKIEPECSTKE